MLQYHRNIVYYYSNTIPNIDESISLTCTVVLAVLARAMNASLDLFASLILVSNVSIELYNFSTALATGVR